MSQKTHLGANPRLLGEITNAGDGTATGELRAIPEMAVDELGLVHGGFTFGLADYVAMVAVNDPNVVLGGSEVRFLAPVRVGELMQAVAEVVEEKGRKRTVRVGVSVGETEVLAGTMTTFVLDDHIFS